MAARSFDEFEYLETFSALDILGLSQSPYAADTDQKRASPNFLRYWINNQSSWVGACVVRTTGNVDIAGGGLAAGTVIDGATLVAGWRVAAFDQTTGSENGIYIVPASGAASRATDFDEDSEVDVGTRFFVHIGATHGDKAFEVNSAEPNAPGTDTITVTEWTPSVTGTDADAIHDNVAGEINALTEKVAPVAGDFIIGEDSADSFNKKKFDIGNLPGGGGGSGTGTASDPRLHSVYPSVSSGNQDWTTQTDVGSYFDTDLKTNGAAFWNHTNNRFEIGAGVSMVMVGANINTSDMRLMRVKHFNSGGTLLDKLELAGRDDTWAGTDQSQTFAGSAPFTVSDGDYITIHALSHDLTASISGGTTDGPASVFWCVDMTNTVGFSGASVINRRVFTNADDASTFTASAGATHAVVKMTGPGGNGGNATNAFNCGGGGASGAESVIFVDDISTINGQTMAIPAGGSGLACTFAGWSVAAGTAGESRTGSGLPDGGNGGAVPAITGANNWGGRPGGNGVANNSSHGQGGNGADSSYGGGGKPGRSFTGSGVGAMTGGNATAPGAGGGGAAANSGTLQNGGTGGDARIVVEEYGGVTDDSGFLRHDTFSAVSTLDVDITDFNLGADDILEAEIKITAISVDDSWLSLRASSDGGTTFPVGRWNVSHKQTLTVSESGASSSVDMIATSTSATRKMGSAAAEGLSALYRLWNLTDANERTRYDVRTVYNEASGAIAEVNGAGGCDTAVAIDLLRLVVQSGTMTGSITWRKRATS